ncbi:MAG: hypothetical protein AB7E05_14830 [Sphingobium sp.]
MMMPSDTDLLGAISHALAENVLTLLEPDSWGAANVRTAINLLAHLEDRSLHESEVLTACNAAMRSLLSPLSHAAPWGDDAMAATIRQAIRVPQGQHGEPAIVLLRQENRDLKAVLSQIVNRVATRGDPDPAHHFAERMRACLRDMNEQEFRIDARASLLRPF